MDDEEKRAREGEELADSTEVFRTEHEQGETVLHSGEVRIAAVEAAVAAGLAPSTGKSESGVPPLPVPPVFELQDWTEPATGQVPRVLLGEGEGFDAPITRGPTWREEATDWEDDGDLTYLVDSDDAVASSAIAGQVEIPPEGVPNPFEFNELNAIGLVAEPVDDNAWAPLFDEVDDEDVVEEEVAPGAAGDRQRRAAHRRKAHSARRVRGSNTPAPVSAPARAHVAWVPRVLTTVGPSTTRSAAMSTVTGLGVGLVALLCFVGGRVSSLVLVVVAVTLAAGEVFGALRRAGYRPATPIGLAGVAAMVIAAYLRGSTGILLIVTVVFAAGGVWFIAQHRSTSVVGDFGATLLVVGWVGGFAAFGGLLLAPSNFPHNHGVAYLVAAVALTVAHDVGSYAVGSKLGRHLIAPTISPKKTVEGLLGGTALALVVAIAVGQIHPIGIDHALLIAIAVGFFAPLGDLVESVIKRNLGIKDMGHLLPAHGGVLDRVDAILFVLPATFYLLRLLNLG